MEIKAEKVNPYDDTRPKTEQVREMFNSIAPAYDFMNRAMTFGLDRWWRRRAVRMLRDVPHDTILDVATGTGDIALLLARKLLPKSVTGVDLSEGMLAVARRKAESANLNSDVRFVEADCLALPFADNMFDCVTVAYGVRNFASLSAGYAEMHRVLRSGGTLCVIELSTPTSRKVLPFYLFYTRRIIPFVGRLVSKDVRAYSYLPESIAVVPQREEMTALMTDAGFCEATFRTLTFGVCTIYLATKSEK